eukprot:TRINITY_DN8649_c0_g1_i2.p1 TRINITY_DN8649_c0_g1~~TRINITY_DN8649_c0_g1_i2.p1  ORF type:complete len:802 (+),score=209.56 TRINITY_DN8649_c0_g1_i2:52-2457(+)
MTVLCGKVTNGQISGSTFVNDYKIELTAFKDYIGFVPQDDVCTEDLTVRENLYFNALLRLPTTFSYAKKEAIVDNVIKLLQLGRVQDTIVGSVVRRGISGGQRKRVNIGLELVALPNILFLDEPTSGLDATASLEILESLEKMAHAGMTIVSVIHQPRFSLFMKFKNVILMGRGSPAYVGSTKRVLKYFEKTLGLNCPESENPADFFLDMIAEHSDLTEHWAKHIKNEQKDDRPESSRNPLDEDLPPKALPTVYQQFGFQLVRSVRQILYSIPDVVSELGLTMVAGFSAGATFGANWLIVQFPTLSSLAGLGMALVAMSTSLSILHKDRLVFWRESQSGVSITGFFYAKMIVQLRQVIIAPFLYAMVFHSLINPDIDLGNWYLLFMAIAWNASGFGLILSVTMDDAALLGTIVLSLVLGGFLAGVYPTLNDLQGAARLLSNISFNRWAGEALSIMESQGLPSYYNTDYLFSFGFTRDNLILDFVVLFALGLLYRVITLITLRFKRRNFNWEQWLLELRDWVTVPIGVAFGILAGFLALGQLSTVSLAVTALQGTVWVYLLFVGNIHLIAYQSIKKNKPLKCPATLTFLQVDMCIPSLPWIFIQILADSLVALFSILWLYADSGGNIPRGDLPYLVAIALFMKAAGFFVLLQRRRSNDDPGSLKVKSALFYVALIALSGASVIALTVDFSRGTYNNPNVLIALPIFGLLLKTIWNTLRGSLAFQFKVGFMFPLVAVYVLAVARYDLGIVFTNLIVVAPLLVYPGAFLGITLPLSLRLIRAFLLLCCKGFTADTTNQLFVSDD